MSRNCKVCGAKAESDYCFRHKPKKRIKAKKKRGGYFEVYDEFFGYDGERPVCEITGRPADQIHHIKPGRYEGCDDPRNLIALVQEIHDLVECRDRKLNELMQSIHDLFIETRKPLHETNPDLCLRITKNLYT